MTVKDAVQFIREVKIELSKVVWPKQDEFIGSTVIVLMLVCAFALYLGLIDLGFAKVAGYVFKFYGGY